ncbi:MAG: hypothetical protein K2X39_01835, partial [Silvanigrellaceae bacterium]|nr:hypothetical protein [Silvanigrellaceae bacterium]
MQERIQTILNFFSDKTLSWPSDEEFERGKKELLFLLNTLSKSNFPLSKEQHSFVMLLICMVIYQELNIGGFESQREALDFGRDLKDIILKQEWPKI